MKLKFTLLLLVASLCCFAQNNKNNSPNIVVCDLTYERTLQGFDVFIHNPSGATVYRAKMYIDADGSPRAYGPNNSGLDYTANAGYPGNWWALVTDSNGDPILQSSNDPYPGMYVCATSLVNSNYAISNPLRYVNSETVPYIAMPTNVLASGNIHVGDVAYVYNTVTGQSCFAIYADAGNTTSIGEGSIYLASQIGVDPDVRTGGTSQGIIDYIVFPGSGFGQGYIPTIAEIDSIGNAWLYSANVGGPGITDCLSPNADNTPPTSAMNVPSGWDTTTFTAYFTDTDNSGGSGVEKTFYNVSDNDGSEWRGNNTLGFFNDNFDKTTIHSEWTQSSGSWSINSNNMLEQNDENSSNTNIYAPLVQNLSNRYLYHFKAKIGGSGTNRRAGFHFFSDAPDSSNRGNSYFVWFRLDNQKIQVYEVVNNSWGSNPVKDTAFALSASTLYDFKIVYDRITGLIRVYVNDIRACDWVDTTPLSNGSYISFRSANCNFQVDDFEVLRTRQPSSVISVGPGNANKIRYQNSSPATPGGRIKSVATDHQANIGTIVSTEINVDWTAPSNVSMLNDGNSNDIDTTYNGTQLQANWSAAVDPNSGISNYYYAVGTSPGATDILNWTTTSDTFATASALSLVHLQTYYFTVKAGDGAGMESAPFNSDGQVYFDIATTIKTEEAVPALIAYPNPGTGQFFIKGLNEGLNKNSVIVRDILGNAVPAVICNNSIDLSANANGLYDVTIIRNNRQEHIKVVVKR